MKIQLYAILNAKVAETLKTTGVYNPVKKLSSYSDYKIGYDWIISKMQPAPKGVELPVWAFPVEGASISIDDIKQGNCLIKFEVEAEECLFTNFSGYHQVLNDSPYIPEEEWERIDKLPDAEQEAAIDAWYNLPEAEKRATWDSIIVRPDYSNEYWVEDIVDCQITFWTLKMSQVTDIIIF